MVASLCGALALVSVSEKVWRCRRQKKHAADDNNKHELSRECRSPRRRSLSCEVLKYHDTQVKVNSRALK